MNNEERLALVASVVSMLRSAGSWTGRIHIQKLIYMSQEFGLILPAYDFVLYQRGPYSFELDADIRELRSIGALDIRPAPPYGPTYVATQLGDTMAALSPIGTASDNRLRGLAARVGAKQAKDLELLATIVFAAWEGLDAKEQVVDRVRELKPHFERLAIEQAVDEVADLRSSFASG